MGSLYLNVQLGAQEVASPWEHDDLRPRDHLDDIVTHLKVALEDALAKRDVVRLEKCVEGRHVGAAHEWLPLFESTCVEVVCLLQFFLVVPICNYD